MSFGPRLPSHDTGSWTTRLSLFAAAPVSHRTHQQHQWYRHRSRRPGSWKPSLSAHTPNALAHLNEELGDLVVNLHVGEDRGTIVRDVDVSVGGDEDLVKTSRAKRRLDDVGDRAGGENVALCVSACCITCLSWKHTRIASRP